VTNDRRKRAASGSTFALVWALGLLAAAGLASCGGNSEALGTGTITRSLPDVTAEREAATVTETVPATTETVVVTETAPGEAQTTSVVTETVTLTETAPAVAETAPAATTSAAAPVTVTETVATTVTETTGVSPAAAAAAAAAAESDEGLSSTEWGWVAFGVLAAAVVLGGIVWGLRKRSAARRGDDASPPANLPT
jgi:hypothetical protein